jgi:hypothetical protein
MNNGITHRQKERRRNCEIATINSLPPNQGYKRIAKQAKEKHA